MYGNFGLNYLMGTNASRKRGMTIEAALCAESHKGLCDNIRSKNVKLDESSHCIKYGTTRQSCKLPKCKGYTHFECEKSVVNLCFEKI